MRKAKVELDNRKLDESSEILRALAHPLRMEILEFIDENDKINVNKIYNTLGLEQSITSQHLRILRLAELVQTKREGKFTYYSINYPKMVHSVKVTHNFIQETEDTTEE